MPEVSRFFGIIIRMFVEAGGQHHMPHFHAYYQDDVGIYDIEKVERLAGSPSEAPRATRARVGRATPARVDDELGNVARRATAY